MIKVGIGFSRTKDLAKAIPEAYRGSLQKLQALRADFAMMAFTYDHAIDAELLAALLKRNLKGVDHLGFSTWSGWTDSEVFEGDSGLCMISFLMPKEKRLIFKIHSLKEKAELWASELIRKFQDSEIAPSSRGTFLFVADGIHFQSGSGMEKLSEAFPHIQFLGFGNSYGIPQCCQIANAEVHSNSLVGILILDYETWSAILQHIEPEAEAIQINRMSENLVIEIDKKPAFYRLTEHLMEADDLPMMSQDEFRKKMGNLYLVERSISPHKSPRTLGHSHRVIPLLGSEMTTGMVAVSEPIDLEKQLFLGQKKKIYAEEQSLETLLRLKEQVPDPAALFVCASSTRSRDPVRTKSDMMILKAVFPGVPIFGVSSQLEFLNGSNQHSAIVLAFRR
jgi:hypothetical protein